MKDIFVFLKWKLSTSILGGKISLSSCLAVFQNSAGFPRPPNIHLVVVAGLETLQKSAFQCFTLCFGLRLKSKTSKPFFLIFELLRSCLLSKSFPAEVEKCGLINKRWMRGETTLSDEHHFTFKDRKQT